MGLSPEEAEALGLPVPKSAKLSAEEAEALGLPVPTQTKSAALVPEDKTGTGKVFNPNSGETETRVGYKLVGPSEQGNTAGVEPESTEKAVFAPPPGANEKATKFTSWLRKYVQGGVSGHGDEVVGSATAASLDNDPGQYLRLQDGTEVPMRTDLEQYRGGRDFERGEMKKTDAQLGKWGMIPQTAGAVTQYVAAAPLIQKMGKALMPALPAGAGAVREAMNLAGANALVPSAVYGSGEAESDLTKGEVPGYLGETAGATVLGTGLGGAVGGAAEALPNSFTQWIKDAGTAIREKARERAVRSVATGANMKEMLGDIGAKTPAAVTKQRVSKTGEYLLDEPQPALNGEPLIKKFQTRRGLSDRMDAVRNQAGQDLDNIRLDIGSRANPEDVLSHEALKARAEGELLPNYKAGEGHHKSRDFVQNEINNAFGGDVSKYDLEAIETLKTNLMKRADSAYKNVGGENPEALKDIASWVKGVGEERAEQLVNKYAPELAGQFEAAKAAYGKIAGPSRAIAGELGRDLKNSEIGLGAKILGAGQGGGEGIAKAADVGKWTLLMNYLKNNAPRNMAVAGNEAGKFFQTLPGEAATAQSAVTPQAFIEWLKTQGQK